ncbi:MAG: hypothetical protein PVG04_02225 [Anaerolineales bacterium]|jgi:hypothetical protein
MNYKHPLSKPYWVIFGAVVISIVAYLAYCAYFFRIGFPLDDAWIHQTYARNLATEGRWIFTANTVSGGSTAPLWTLLLSLGYLIGLPSKLWAYFLGGVTLFTTAVFSVRWYQAKTDEGGLSAVGLGLLIVFEWHLVWAAVSGMETLLMGGIAVAVFWMIMQSPQRFWLAGILIGLGMWVRPDALLLILPVLWILFSPSNAEVSAQFTAARTFRVLAGACMLAIPYLFFNYLTAGSVWPTTFFAKQAEYAVLLETPLMLRTLEIVQAPLAGVGVLLLPAFLYHAFDLIWKKQYANLAPFVWVASYIGAYVLRLPVSYQHGRYLMPVLPVSLVLAYIGLNKLVGLLSERRAVRILQRTWIISIILIAPIFWVIGARAYGQDVAIIESEMVDTAKWIRDNTPSGAKIAAHDIGAFGYYANRDLLDLAGLVSPEVIPIIRDEQALEVLMNSEDVDYLMTFPGWYPHLTEVGEKLYQTEARFSPEQGGENMAVYRWP